MAQVIDEYRELLGEYLHYSSILSIEYHHRNAICISVCNQTGHEASLANKHAKHPALAMRCIHSVFGTNVPVIPNHNARADQDDQIKRLLGSEHAVVVVDATRQWPDDVLGAAAGAVKTPGLLIILLPMLLECSTVTASPYERYFKRALTQHVHKQTLHGVYALHSLKPNRLAPKLPCGPPYWAAEQQEIKCNIVSRCCSQAASLDVLTARRGRGKSAVLGQIIHSLSQQQALSVKLTATHPDHVFNALQRAKTSAVKFTPLDQTVNMDGDILFVDEAGSVPLPVLKKLAIQYRHLVLAGTVDGYEGSGRAFELRLNDVATAGVERHKPSSQYLIRHQLHQPIRWPADDALEAMVSDVLRLNDYAVTPSRLSFKPTDGVNTHKISYGRVSSQQLLDKPALLDQIFALLLQAHYQTTSHDLRLLLEQPNLTLWAQWCDERVTGAGLVAHEGGIEDELVEGILAGERRPAHQRLPMLLHRQSGAEAVLRSHAWRIVRIAVLPDLQNRGLGSKLLKHIVECANNKDASHHPVPTFIGASFGATAEGLRFWQRANFQCIHFGYRVNPRSGQRAVAVARACQPNSKDAQHVHTAHGHFADSLSAVQSLCASYPLIAAQLYGQQCMEESRFNELRQLKGAEQGVKTNGPTITSDLQRLDLWQRGHLNLHEVWGPVMRAMGGSEGLAALRFSDKDSAKSITQAVLHHVVTRLAEK